jgi:hypothetical protein
LFFSRQCWQLWPRFYVRVLPWSSISWLCATKSARCKGPPQGARKLTSGDRLFWICFPRLWRDWRSALVIVKPETVVAWHRACCRLFWTWKVQRAQRGRPIISREV